MLKATLLCWMFLVLFSTTTGVCGKETRGNDEDGLLGRDGRRISATDVTPATARANYRIIRPISRCRFGALLDNITSQIDNSILNRPSDAYILACTRANIRVIAIAVAKFDTWESRNVT